jgi:hypothetical protein
MNLSEAATDEDLRRPLFVTKKASAELAHGTASPKNPPRHGFTSALAS